MTSPLRSAQLRRILIAYTVNRLGTWIGLLALLVAVFDHTHNALAVSALLLAGQALPVFLVAAVVARVEASERRHELTGLYCFEALVTALLAVLMSHFSLPVVLFLAALDGVAALAASSLLRAEVARVAREQAERERTAMRFTPAQILDHSGPQVADSTEEAERKANAALNVCSSTSFVLGPVIGGAIVAAAGASTALFIDAGSFLICGALLLDLHPHVDEAEGGSVRARLRAAWRFISEAPSLRGLLLAEAVALVFFEAGAPIEVTYAKTTLHAGDRGLGLLLTTWGAGGILGSVAFARLVRRPLGVMLSVGTVVIAIGYLGLAVAPSLALACIAGFAGGVGNGMQWPSLISIVQRLSPARLHGRLMGAVESLGALAVAIGLPLGGVLVALSSPRVAFVVIGLGALAVTVALAKLSLDRRAAPELA
ncbi:MAG TPA: MFS transporter, partial [Solirubrobacteraceae bacterium]|nr:MFS transporter [Solirubrobacteraceae bacterium]